MLDLYVLINFRHHWTAYLCITWTLPLFPWFHSWPGQKSEKLKDAASFALRSDIQGSPMSPPDHPANAISSLDLERNSTYISVKDRAAIIHYPFRIRGIDCWDFGDWNKVRKNNIFNCFCFCFYENRSSCSSRSRVDGCFRNRFLLPNFRIGYEIKRVLRVNGNYIINEKGNSVFLFFLFFSFFPFSCS